MCKSACFLHIKSYEWKHVQVLGVIKYCVWVHLGDAHRISWDCCEVISSLVGEGVNVCELNSFKGMEQTQYLHYWKELPQLLYIHVIVFHLLYHLPCLQSYTLKGLIWESYGSGLSELANTATNSSYVYIQAVLLLYILSKLWINFWSWIRRKDVLLLAYQ